MKRVLVASMFILASLHGFAQYDVAVEAPDTTTVPELPTNDVTPVQRTLPTSGTQQFSDLESQISTLNAQVSALQADLSNLKSQISTLKSTASLSYDSVLRAMPQYAIVQHRVAELRKAYEAEMKRVEDEFNQKYEEFLEGRKDYPRTILLKRQNELQDMLQQNIAFRNRALDELRQAETEALAPLRQQLMQAVATVAKRKSLRHVINTDRDAALYLDPNFTIDITADVLEVIGE